MVSVLATSSRLLLLDWLTHTHNHLSLRHLALHNRLSIRLLLLLHLRLPHVLLHLSRVPERHGLLLLHLKYVSVLGVLNLVHNNLRVCLS